MVKLDSIENKWSNEDFKLSIDYTTIPHKIISQELHNIDYAEFTKVIGINYYLCYLQLLIPIVLPILNQIKK